MARRCLEAAAPCSWAVVAVTLALQLRCLVARRAGVDLATWGGGEQASLRARGGFEEPSRPDGYHRHHISHDEYGHSEGYDSHPLIFHDEPHLPATLQSLNLFWCEAAGAPPPLDLSEEALVFDHFMETYFRNHVLGPVDRFAEALDFICEVEHVTHPEDHHDGGAHDLCEHAKALSVIADTKEALEVFDEVREQWANWARGKKVNVADRAGAPDGIVQHPPPPPDFEFDLNPNIAWHIANARAEAAAAKAGLPNHEHTWHLETPPVVEETPRRRHRHIKSMQTMNVGLGRNSTAVSKRAFWKGVFAAGIFSATRRGAPEADVLDPAARRQIQEDVDAAIHADPSLRWTHVLDTEFISGHHAKAIAAGLVATKGATAIMKDGGLLLGPGIGYPSSDAALRSMLAATEEVADTSIAVTHLADAVEHIAPLHELLSDTVVPAEVRNVVKTATTVVKQEYDPHYMLSGATSITDEVAAHGHGEIRLLDDLMSLAVLSDTVVSSTGTLKAYVETKAKLIALKTASALPAFSAAAAMADEDLEFESLADTKVMMDLVKGSDAIVRLASLWNRLPKELCSAMKHSLTDLHTYVDSLQSFLHQMH